jgi:hypothetical protein
MKDTDLDLHIRVFKKIIELMGKLWKLISSTCLVSLYEIVFWNGVKTLYMIIPIAFLRNWNKHFANLFEL